MADDTERLVVLLEAKVRDFERAMQRAERTGTQSHKQLTRSSSKMSSDMKKHFDSAAASFKTFAAGFVSIAAMRSIGQFGKAAINSADEVATAASRIGIAADQFQRFRFAAEQADVETKELDDALRKFAQNLSTGTISAQGRDLAESFRNYIEQIANAPSHLEKVSLAQKAFGRQWQTAILLAAQGAEEFQKQADSAFVFSTKALAAAGEFDNRLRSVRNAVELGFGTGFIEAFSGSLTTSREELVQLNQAAEEFGRVSARVFKAATEAVSVLGREMAENQRQTAAYMDAVNQWKEGTMGLGDLASVLMDPRAHMRRMKGIQQSSDWWSGDGGDEGGDAAPSGLGGQIEAAKALAAHEANMNALLAERQALVAGLVTPWQQYGDTLAKINALQEANTLTAQDAAKVQMAAAAQMSGAYLDAAGNVAGALSGLFEKNKELAIASATINTLVGITKAFELPFPLNFAQAAAVSIAGFAQVSKIRSTTSAGGGSGAGISGISSGGPGSGGYKPLGGGAQSPVAPAAAPTQRAGQGAHITLEGDFFSREQVFKLIDGINEALGDGKTISAT